jgi:tyrosine-protein phosphatase SIW14
VRLNGKFARIFSTAVFIGSLGVMPVAAGTGSAARPAAAAIDVSRIRIDNFGRVSDTYFRGAQPKGSDYADLAAIGVKTVVDLTKDGDQSEPADVQRAGMQFHRIPMTTHDVPTEAELAQFLQIVDDPANQPVYVHCQGGRHRTGVMTAVFRMTKDGWSPDRAFAEMKQYKFGSDFLHPEFKSFVYDYAAEMAHAAAATPVKTRD